MNGPEHYREAERLIAGPTFSTARQGPVPSADPAAVAVAQVHMGLALIAVLADRLGGGSGDQWTEATS